MCQTFLDRPLSQSTMDWARHAALIMLVGVGARAAFDQFSVSSFRAGIYAIAGAACALIAAISHLGTAFVALGGAIMIMSLARIDAHAKPTFLSTKTLCKLGGWSYAIFILHVPIFIILKTGLMCWASLVVNSWTSLAFTGRGRDFYPAHHLIEEPCLAHPRQLERPQERVRASERLADSCRVSFSRNKPCSGKVRSAFPDDI